MPEPISATVAFVTAAYSSAVAATATVLGAMGTVGALGMGGTYALAGAIVKGGVMLGLSAASAALLRPNTPSSGTTLDFKPDPKAPVRGAMGYTALGGNKVFQATWGYKKVAMSLGVALSLGPIDQVPRFEADGATVTFSGPQNEATGFYAADMWQRTTLGLPGDAALLPPTGLKYGNPGLTGWGTQHAAPQVSFSFWTMVLAKNPEDRDVFTNGVPDPRWIGRWMKLWDPRKDSTYPGGSGPQRRDDWRTWEWSENPYVHSLAWFRGHYKLNLDGTVDRRKRIAGVGAPDSAIDIPAFVEGMNIADANAWTISGEWSTSDGKFQTALAMLQAGGGEPISRGAQISVMVNAPRVATYTYTRDDLIGQAEIRPLTPRRERKNTIIPRYKSEANGWQYVPAGEVTSSVYRDEDRGEPRSLEIEYTHVRNAKQAGQLAAYDLANLREGLTATLPSKVHLMHVHPGDCITVDVPELALAGQKFIVRRATTNHQSASVTLELRSESDGKHAWALGQAAQPAPSPSLPAVDPKYVPPPVPGDWTVVPKPPGDGGVSQPIVIIELPIDTTDIVAVIIRHGPSAAGPWTDGYEGSPRPDGRYEVSGLTPGQTYCFSLQYVAKNGAKSDPDIKCGVVAGDLIAGGLSPDAAEKVVREVLDQVGDIAAGTEAAEQVAELVLETILNENDALVKEAKERGEGIAIAYQGAVQHADNKIAEVTYTMATIAMMNDAQAATLNQSRSYTDGRVATAMNMVYTKAEVDTGRAITLQEAKSYSDAKSQEASLLYATKAERENGDAATYASMKSYVDAYKVEANLTFATTSQFNGVSATAAIALSTAQSAETKLNEARIRIVASSSGGQPALAEFYSADGEGSHILLGADQIGFVTGSQRKPILTLSDGEAAINGNLVVTGSIRSNAITKGASAASAIETNVGLNTWTDLLQVSMASGGGEVSIDFGAQVSAVNAGGQNALIEVRFLRDGVVLDTMPVMDLLGAQTIYVQGNQDPFQTYVQINTVVSSYIHPFTVDVGAAAGAHTWKVQMRSAAGATVGAKKMRLLETKR